MVLFKITSKILGNMIKGSVKSYGKAAKQTKVGGIPPGSLKGGLVNWEKLIGTKHKTEDHGHMDTCVVILCVYLSPISLSLDFQLVWCAKDWLPNAIITIKSHKYRTYLQWYTMEFCGLKLDTTHQKSSFHNF